MENLTVSFRPEVIDDDIHRVAFEFKLKELLVGVFKVPIARNEQRLIDLSKCTDVDTKYFKMSTEGHISVCVKGPVVFFDAHDDYSELSLSAPLEACRGAFDEMAAHVMKVRVPPEMYYGMVALKAEYEGSWFGVKYLPDHNPQPQCTKSWQISAPSMCCRWYHLRLHSATAVCWALRDLSGGRGETTCHGRVLHVQRRAPRWRLLCVRLGTLQAGVR